MPGSQKCDGPRPLFGRDPGRFSKTGFGNFFRATKEINYNRKTGGHFSTSERPQHHGKSVLDFVILWRDPARNTAKQAGNRRRNKTGCLFCGPSGSGAKQAGGEPSRQRPTKTGRGQAKQADPNGTRGRALLGYSFGGASLPTMVDRMRV